MGYEPKSKPKLNSLLFLWLLLPLILCFPSRTDFLKIRINHGDQCWYLPEGDLLSSCLNTYLAWFLGAGWRETELRSVGWASCRRPPDLDLAVIPRAPVGQSSLFSCRQCLHLAGITVSVFTYMGYFISTVSCGLHFSCHPVHILRSGRANI